MFPTPIEFKKPWRRWLYKLSIPIVLFLWLVPLLAVVLTSMRSLSDITQGNYWGWPEEFAMLTNYTTVFKNTPMLRYFLNSLIITLPVVFVTIAISSLAGFALAKYKFKGNVLIFALFIGGNFVPYQILMIPVRNLFTDTNLYDTYWSLIIFHTAFQAGFCTLFLRNFITTLPHEMFESGRVEGASEWRIYTHIALPCLRPALAALAVLIFTFVWNDFFWALVLVQSDEVRPITVGLNALRGQWVASWQLVSAGSIVAALPPVVMFFLMQRHFIAGLTLGATKG